MDKAKITFLGTGSAIPTAKRNHSSILVQYKKDNLLFDCGEGTQRQFRKARLNPCKINKIFISHWHGDHILGLPGILQTLAFSDATMEITLYGPRGSKRKFQELVAPYLNKEAKNSINIEVNEAKEGTILATEEFEINATPTDHDCNGLTYSLTLKERKRLDAKKLKELKIPNGPLIGELAKGKKVKINNKTVDGKKLIYAEPERKLTFIFDTAFNKELIKFSKDSNIIISESTYFDEEELAREYKHMTALQAIEILKKSKSKKLILFHLSQRLQSTIKSMEKEIEKLSKATLIANDLDSFEI
jgi:ribonuclease Z